MENTSFLVSADEFQIMERFCDRSHPHESWGFDRELGVLSTSKELRRLNILEALVFNT